MSCCGSRRAALKHGNGLRTAAAQPTVATPLVPADAVGLTYHGPVPMVLPSPAGGPPYAMEQPGQRIDVDARDAEALLHTGWFAAA